MLKNGKGDWVDEEESLKQMAMKYYEELYRAADQVQEFPLRNLFPRLSDEILARFENPVSLKEIEEVVFSIGAFKAPGPDGLNGLFFHSQWDYIKDLVKDVFKEVFEDRKKLRLINQTMIVMIPKVERPENVKQFRPINLYNVIFKVVSKILANRLKEELDSLIAPLQMQLCEWKTQFKQCSHSAGDNSFYED